MAKLQLIKQNYLLLFLLFFLLIELAAAVYPIKVETLIKNNLADWPWSIFTRNDAELIVNKPTLLSFKKTSWEKILTEENESRDLLLRLALLSYQLYDDDKARVYWQRAFYLDPELVASLPRPPGL